MCSNIVINVTSLYIFNSIHSGLSCHKCTKEIFKLSHPIVMKGGGKNMYNQITFILRNNMEIYYPCTWLSFLNQGNEKIRDWSLLMKIIYCS